MRETINIAIVGFGNIAKSHYLGAQCANVRMDLPFNINISHIISKRSELNGPNNEPVYPTIKAAIESGVPIDVIDICNVNDLHFDCIKEAVEHGIPIYCEKPLTDNLTDSEAALELAKKSNLLTGVPFIFRYIPAVHLLKEALEQNVLGPVIEFKSTFYHDSYLNEVKRQSWRVKKSCGGGASIDLSIHFVDLMRFIFGDISSADTKTKIHFPNIDNDEVSFTNLSFESGVTGSIETSRIFNQRQCENKIEVFCEKGSFCCDLLRPYELEINHFKGNTVIQRSASEKIMQYAIPEGASLNYHQDGHTACIADMARKVYDQSHSGFGATFLDAFIAQKHVTVD